MPPKFDPSQVVDVYLAKRSVRPVPLRRRSVRWDSPRGHSEVDSEGLEGTSCNGEADRVEPPDEGVGCVAGAGAEDEKHQAQWEHIQIHIIATLKILTATFSFSSSFFQLRTRLGQ